ncbi:hypothetical protein [Aliivibrio logei]|uniref:hypothetical protein n=1 Tax=Aliivibrio logei TaxID=688 RepID=UPI00039C7E12|nr:hypothetical protein [Aliivibrio logei]
MNIQVKPHPILSEAYILDMNGASLYFDEYQISSLHLFLYLHSRMIASFPISIFLNETLEQLTALNVPEVEKEKGV